MEAPTSTTTSATTADSDLTGTTADQNGTTSDEKATTTDQNGTTSDEKETTADQNGTTSDEKATSADQTPTTTDHQRRHLQSLHDKGGFVLSCKTVVTLHRVQTAAVAQDGEKDDKKEEQQKEEERGWEMVGGGILSILSQRDKLCLLLSDPASGEVTQEFKLGTSTCTYASLSSHFHSFVATNGDENQDRVVHGMSFADINVAVKVLRIIRRLSSSADDGVGGAGVVAGDNTDSGPPATKRVKLDGQDKYSEWVVINREDVPVISESNEAEVGGVVETSGVEETDFSLFSRKKKEDKMDFKIDDVSGPSYFRHLTQTSDQPGSSAPNPAPSSTGTAQPEELGEAGGEVQKRTGTFERGTKRSSSFMEFETLEEKQHQQLVPIPVTPPIAPSQSFISSSSGDLTTSTSFASSFSGSSVELPPPPPHDSSHETLVYQINTFDCKNLHHVTPEEMAAGGMGEKESGLGSILRGGFERMMPRLMEKFGVAAFVSISPEGDEEWSDDFDGNLFE